MDQLKPILRVLRIHSFWFISGAVLLAFMSMWFLTTKRLREETLSRESAIDGMFSQVSRIAGEPLHPNTHSQKGMDLLHNKYFRELQAAWADQYQQQVKDLRWPDMGPDFIRVVERLKPIETTVGFNLPPQDEPLTKDQRNRYRYFIQAELPKLAEIVGGHWHPSGVPPEGAEFVVDWNATNQQNIQDTRFSWRTATPTTLDVVYAQEDIWVLDALLNVIKRVNGDVKGKYQAAIKEIDFLEIGPDAIGLAGNVTSLVEAAVAGEYGDPMSEQQPPPSVPGEGGSVAVDPAERRYVDKDFQPITAERLRAAYDSEKPEDAILAVAKRIPVRMRVTIDQRKISRLLAECANYKMQVEIRQVRINCESGSTYRGTTGRGPGGGGSENIESSGSTFGGSSSGYGGGVGGVGGVDGGGFSEGDGGMFGSPRPQVQLKDSSPWDVTLELYGIVYFYNPVSIDKIGKKLAPVTSGDAVPTEAGG